MRLKVSEKSLFAILMRSSWWVSVAVALLLALAARLLAPEEYFIPALSICFPFLVIAAMAAWKQSRQPGAGQVEATVATVSAMSWRDFADVLEQAYLREGYAVTRVAGAADFRLEKDGRSALVCGKRWKAANHGVEPLRELQLLREKLDVQDVIYIALGSVSDNGRRFAGEHRIRLVGDAELTALLRLPRRAKATP